MAFFRLMVPACAKPSAGDCSMTKVLAMIMNAVSPSSYASQAELQMADDIVEPRDRTTLGVAASPVTRGYNASLASGAHPTKLDGVNRFTNMNI